MKPAFKRKCTEIKTMTYDYREKRQTGNGRCSLDYGNTRLGQERVSAKAYVVLASVGLIIVCVLALVGVL